MGEKYNLGILAFYKARLFNEYINSNDIHNPDANILLDAFKLSNLIGDKLCFITLDNGIINKRDAISREFNKQVVPKNPNDFL